MIAVSGIYFLPGPAFSERREDTTAARWWWWWWWWWGERQQEAHNKGYIIIQFLHFPLLLHFFILVSKTVTGAFYTNLFLVGYDIYKGATEVRIIIGWWCNDRGQRKSIFL
jgi:hypothetical protein